MAHGAQAHSADLRGGDAQQLPVIRLGRETRFQSLLATRGATVTAIRIFEQLPEHPVITMSLATRMLSTTKPTVGKAIEVVMKAGILAEVGERKRDRLYRYDRYLGLLD